MIFIREMFVLYTGTWSRGWWWQLGKIDGFYVESSLCLILMYHTSDLCVILLCCEKSGSIFLSALNR